MTCLPVLAALALAASPSELSNWEDQLQEMEYYLLQLSAINAVNGMNLTPEQAKTLRGLARRVEASGAWRPRPGLKREPRLQQVSETYAELRRAILAGKSLPQDLERRVMKARVLEAAVIRESLSARPSSAERRGRCTRCHVMPGRSKIDSQAAEQRLKMMRAPTNRRTVFLAHFYGLYGKKGGAMVWRAAPRIDALLTDAQKEIVQKFSCCLAPPEDLASPVRAGQADVPARVMKLMRSVRAASPEKWRWVKPALLNRLCAGERARKPAITEEELAERRKHFESVFEKARRMSEVDFEMEKENLCRELRNAPPPEKRPDRIKRFVAAMFLLAPGMSEVYAAVIERQRGG